MHEFVLWKLLGLKNLITDLHGLLALFEYSEQVTDVVILYISLTITVSERRIISINTCYSCDEFRN
jgi:hypothetical protein